MAQGTFNWNAAIAGLALGAAIGISTKLSNSKLSVTKSSMPPIQLTLMGDPLELGTFNSTAAWMSNVNSFYPVREILTSKDPATIQRDTMVFRSKAEYAIPTPSLRYAEGNMEPLDLQYTNKVYTLYANNDY